MSSNVYFFDFRSSGMKNNTIQKLQKLLQLEEFKDIFQPEDLTAIKLHFGEKGNNAFVSPVYIRQCVDYLKSLGVKPFVTDTNTLYKGSRANAIDHIRTALEHGFSYPTINAPIIIADGLKSQDYSEVEINQEHFKKVRIANNIIEADSMLVVSHFKGHELSGYGGAIKNLAMGCAPVAGKMDQHSARPDVNESLCNGCGICVKICDWNAYKIENNISKIDKSLCVGCGKCLNICPQNAIYLDWETDINEFIKRMTEYAYGAIKNKQGKLLFINVVNNISPVCDCYGFNDIPIAENVGILASTDPLALDKACFDLVNKAKPIRNSALPKDYKQGDDKFKAIHPYVDSMSQISYGEKVGLGIGIYNLQKIN
ncbi:DUF362 domain-containing protein [Candidatus Margulisiibacteriota bacterium]